MYNNNIKQLWACDYCSKGILICAYYYNHNVLWAHYEVYMFIMYWRRGFKDGGTWMNNNRHESWAERVSMADYMTHNDIVHSSKLPHLARRSHRGRRECLNIRLPFRALACCSPGGRRWCIRLLSLLPEPVLHWTSSTSSLQSSVFVSTRVSERLPVVRAEALLSPSVISLDSRRPWMPRSGLT